MSNFELKLQLLDEETGRSGDLQNHLTAKVDAFQLVKRAL